MKEFGTILIAIGSLWLFASFNMDTSVIVPSETFGEGEFAITTEEQKVNNFGLMNDQQNYIMGSGLTIIIGILLFIKDRKEEENTIDVKRLNKSTPTLEEFLKGDVKTSNTEISTPEDSIDKLLKLSEMLEKKLITKEEFISQKNLLLKNRRV